ncbi:unnamed protein product, partial [Larinioides sclopetarius]
MKIRNRLTTVHDLRCIRAQLRILRGTSAPLGYSTVYMKIRNRLTTVHDLRCIRAQLRILRGTRA